VSAWVEEVWMTLRTCCDVAFPPACVVVTTRAARWRRLRRSLAWTTTASAGVFGVLLPSRVWCESNLWPLFLAHRWDLRDARGKVAESPVVNYQDGKDYSRGTNFNCMATSGDGFVVIGSQVWSM
jgi:hypothetical protein